MSFTSDFLFCLLGSGDGAQAKEAYHVRVEMYSKSQRGTKKLLLESSNNEKRGKKFFAFTFGFACATIATTKSQKAELKLNALV
jgi:xanthine dehydrogenase molybdopterin-binding subunit B